jgi:hypothetical protein
MHLWRSGWEHAHCSTGCPTMPSAELPCSQRSMPRELAADMAQQEAGRGGSLDRRHRSGLGVVVGLWHRLSDTQCMPQAGLCSGTCSGHTTTHSPGVRGCNRFKVAPVGVMPHICTTPCCASPRPWPGVANGVPCWLRYRQQKGGEVGQQGMQLWAGHRGAKSTAELHSPNWCSGRPGSERHHHQGHNRGWGWCPPCRVGLDATGQRLHCAHVNITGSTDGG